jgi:hypothetical protein
MTELIFLLLLINICIYIIKYHCNTHIHAYIHTHKEFFFICRLFGIEIKTQEDVLIYLMSIDGKMMN